MSILWKSTQRARTQHQCSACNRTINPGETYQRQRVLPPTADDPFTYKGCAHCTAFVDLYLTDFCPDPYDGWYREDVEEWEPQTDAAREHKRRWLIKWKHGRDLYPVPTAEAEVTS
jgi:hypothetical protein